jgi:hypothetical protein
VRLTRESGLAGLAGVEGVPEPRLRSNCSGQDEKRGVKKEHRKRPWPNRSLEAAMSMGGGGGRMPLECGEGSLNFGGSRGAEVEKEREIS